MKKAEFAELTWSSQIGVILSNLRVVPRLALGLYGFMCYESYEWFTGLENPSNAQSAFVTILWSASAVWFNFYLSATRKVRRESDFSEVDDK